MWKTRYLVVVFCLVVFFKPLYMTSQLNWKRSKMNFLIFHQILWNFLFKMLLFTSPLRKLAILLLERGPKFHNFAYLEVTPIFTLWSCLLHTRSVSQQNLGGVLEECWTINTRLIPWNYLIHINISIFLLNMIIIPQYYYNEEKFKQWG